MLEKQNRKECLLSLISAVIVVLCSCIGIVMNLTTLHDENFDHMGIQTFCMFTVNSNILVAITMGLIVPYAIDGLRKRYFHLPNWLVVLVFTGCVSVTLTFLVSLFVLAPVKGFVLIFTGSRFFLHGLGPVCAFIAFSFFITDHFVTYRNCLVSLVPVLIYAFVYFTLVVLIGEENGGWNDFYGFATRLPVWIPMLLILPITFGIACLLRFFHNRSFRRLREVRETNEFSREYLIQEITYLARQNAMADTLHSDIVIPRRFIKFLIENTDSDKSVRDVCSMYLNIFLDNTKY
ncbi:MAG: hypothetical protein K6A68_11370 [Clostridiales bacterium]|nr:hypothetical protein [Clostridia bacterium]MCR4884165.1 hypothetical protein [Clostridiales bacterium]